MLGIGASLEDLSFGLASGFAQARREAFDPADSVLAHGDAHAWNTLLDPTTNQRKFVDPDGLFIERAHDLSISISEWSAELLASDPVALAWKRCALLSRLTGVPENAIWQCGNDQSAHEQLGPLRILPPGSRRRRGAQQATTKHAKVPVF